MLNEETLIQYINDNKLAYKIIDIMLFNKEGFLFEPLLKPSFLCVGNQISPLANGYNIIETGFSKPCFVVDDENKNSLRKIIEKPENVYAYKVRYEDEVYLDYYYDRSPEKAKEWMLSEGLLLYMLLCPMDSIDDFEKRARRAERIRKNKYSGMIIAESEIADSQMLMSPSLMESVKHHGLNANQLLVQYSNRLLNIETEIRKDLIVSMETKYDVRQLERKSVLFSSKSVFIPVKNLRTLIDRPVAIVSSEDTIPNILYNLAVSLKANKMYVATGFVYDSGLQMIEPATYIVKHMPNSQVEFVVGSLQMYGNKSVKNMNRKTAKRLNLLRERRMCDHLYTCRERFFHGKFYYISNGEVSFVISGSSNVTKPAYDKNYEFDIIQKFDLRDEQQAALEKNFVDWFIELKSSCEEIGELDVSQFEANCYDNEEGTKAVSKILKTLTDEQEKKRYYYLLGYNPSEIQEFPFKRDRAKRVFKDYSIFVYETMNLVVLEGFSYGNSCYIFSTNDIDALMSTIDWKSKIDVQALSCFVATVKHDESYKETLDSIFQGRLK